MIDPVLVQRLMEIPAVNDLLDFMGEEAKKLDNLFDITLTDPNEIALEVKARQKAHETIINIMKPLLQSTQYVKMNTTGSEYVT